MKGNNFFHANRTGVAIKPVSLASAAATATQIDEPWKYGDQITFFLLAGVFAAGATATCTIQGLKRSDGTTWETIKNAAGTDIGFTASELADGGALETAGFFQGTLNLYDVDSTTYKALRILFTAGTANAQLIAAAYVISDLKRVPSGQTDKLFALAHTPAP